MIATTVTAVSFDLPLLLKSGWTLTQLGDYLDLLENYARTQRRFDDGCYNLAFSLGFSRVKIAAITATPK